MNPRRPDRKIGREAKQVFVSEGQGAMGRACRTMSIIKRGAGGKVGQLMMRTTMMISLTPQPLSAAFPFQGTRIK